MFGIVTTPVTATEIGKYPVFGLNSNCTIKDISFVDEQSQFIGITIDVDGYDISKRYYAPNKVFSKNGGELTDTESAEYKQRLLELKSELSSCVNHIMGAVVGIEQWHSIVSKGFASFEEYAKKCEHTFKHAHKPVVVDIFLQYSWVAKDGKKFLELPKSVKYGAFICKATGIQYEAVRTEKGLSYINGEKLHPFTRGKWFMESEFAKKGGDENIVSTPNADVLPF